MSHSDIHLSVSLPYSPAAFLSHSLPFLDMGHFLCLSFLHAIIGMTSGRRKTLHVSVAFSRVWAKQMSGRALRCWCHAAWATDFISDASQPSGGKWGVCFNLSVLQLPVVMGRQQCSCQWAVSYYTESSILVCIFIQGTSPPAPATFQAP